MVGIYKKKGLTRVAVYLNEAEIISMSEQAEKLKFRRVGIPLKTQKPHGFQHEWVANTDGISKYLKFCHDYYVKFEPERLEKLLMLKRKEQEIIEEKKKLERG